MEIPYTPLQYPTDNPFEPLVQAAISHKKMKLEAAQNLSRAKMEQQKLDMEKEHLQTEKLGQVMPYLDPSAPTYNPAMAETMAKLHGLQLTQQQGAAPPMPQEPQQPPPFQPAPTPQAPEFVGPIDTPEHIRMRGLAAPTRVSGPIPGMIHQGNIDLTNRPDVANPDGTHSSVRSMSFNVDGREVLVPTVSEDGRIMDDEEAMQQYMSGGRNLGQFTNPHAATAYAQRLHQQQEQAGDAVAEATKQQAERDKFAQALMEGKKRVSEHAAEMEHYLSQRDAYQQAMKQREATIAEQQAHPTFQIGAPGQAPATIDTRQIFRQTAGSRQERAKQAAAAYAADPQLAKAAGQMATMGFSDEQIAQAIEKRFTPMSGLERAANALTEKAREANQTDATKRLAIAAKKKPAGTGGGHAAAGLAELIKMKEEGKPDSAIAARAAELHIPAGGKGGWLQNTKEVVRGGAVSFRTGERQAAEDITGANGEHLGTAKSPQEAVALNKSNAAYDQLRVRGEALIRDIEEHGDRELDPAAMQRRNSLMASFAAAGRVYNGLGSTDASQKLEQLIASDAGTPGHGFFMGANKDILRHLLDEAATQHDARLRIRLRSNSGPAAGTGKAPEQPNALTAAARQQGGGPTRKVVMPDNSVAEFDAQGRRIK